MTAWLVCRNCKIKETLLAATPIAPCQVCGAARFAENDDGHPVVLWSVPQDPSDFNPSKAKPFVDR